MALVRIGEALAASAGLAFVQLAGIAPSLDESEGRGGNAREEFPAWVGRLQYGGA